MHGWKTKFKEIRKEFGYREKDDFLSAKKLNSLLEKRFSKKQLQEKITDKTVFIIGAGPSLSKSLTYIKKCKNVTKIVADGAVEALSKKDIKPDILVTDLDGDLNSIRKIGRTKIPIIVHAHGDNHDKLEIVKEFANVVGTTQTEEFGKMKNFGGFTDGDRCVFLANHFKAKKIILFGMDFGTRIGRYSKTRVVDRNIKIAKLQRGKKLLEWLAQKSQSELYSTTRIEGFMKINFQDIDNVIT